jgi:Heterokaryon incompatibility protein (HET)
VEVSSRTLKAFPGSGSVLEKAAACFRGCHTSHGCFKPELRSAGPSRLLLISPAFGNISLSEGFEIQHLSRYAALSRSHPAYRIGKSANWYLKGYCWGGDQVFSLKKSNIDAYKTSIPHETLPQTIKDAVKVTLRLGLSYLWVDSLCIVQDDDDDKSAEIRKMADIYSGSAVTIVAARARSCHDGFLHERTLPDLWCNSTFRLRYRCLDGEICRVFLSEYDDLVEYREPLDERAWTLQERALSPRVLSFGSRKTRWKCISHAEIDGGMPMPVELGNPLETELDGALLRGGPLLGDAHARLWRRMSVDYSRRSLSVPSDKLRAISGLAIAMARFSPEKPLEYAAGLWVYDMPWCLLWSRNGNLPNNEARLRPAYRAPSWSWASIEGEIQYPNSNPLPDIGRPTDDFSTWHSFDKTCVQIFNVEVYRHQNPDDLFGPVSLAVLQIGGMAKKARRNGESSIQCIETGRTIIVETTLDAVEPDFEEVWVFVLGVYTSTRLPSYLGILVTDPVGMNGHRRVGFFESNSDSYDAVRQRLADETGSQDLIHFDQWMVSGQTEATSQLFAIA